MWGLGVYRPLKFTLLVLDIVESKKYLNTAKRPITARPILRTRHADLFVICIIYLLLRSIRYGTVVVAVSKTNT
jgi:hypothetical protein